MAFTFGAPAGGASGSGTSTPTFGQAANANKPATSNIFGGTPTTSAAPTGGFFGNTPTTTAASTGGLFGNAKPAGGNMFGGTATTTPAAGGSLFGNPAGNKPAGLTFGGGASSPATTAPATGGFSFGTAKKDIPSGQSTPTTEAPGGGLFAGVKPSGGNLFGGGSTTPATKSAFSFPSTTPAGPPPADNAPKAAAPSGALFSSVGQSSNAPMFGGIKAADQTATTAPTNSSPLTFGGNNNAPLASTPSLFGGAASKPAPPTGPSLFNLGKPATESSTPASAAAAPTTKPAFSFSSATKPAESAPSSSASTVFGGTSSATPTSTTPAPSTSLFNKPAVPAAQASTTSLFGPKPTETPAAVSSTPTTSSTPAPANAAPNLFGGSLNTNKSAAAPAPATTSTPANPPVAATNQPLGASTAGPAPQMSRLKNKTMDEIITRWASDLLKYQKEFQSQAEKVSAWDRVLVDNGEKIQKLYLSTFEAERASAEVERRLTSVESQQDELSSLLDRYERNVEVLFEKGVGGGEGLQGPDQERERVYRTAEKLDERLEEMMKDLSGMIGEVNEASSSLSKTSKADDPLSQIVRVLNGHLNQLQWIDQNAAQLQAKVAAAQKASQAQLSQSTRENDSADDFYKSFMGGGRR